MIEIRNIIEKDFTLKEVIELLQACNENKLITINTQDFDVSHKNLIKVINSEDCRIELRFCD